MSNATEQTTGRSRRGTLVILFLVAAVGVGLWLALERPKPVEPASTAKPTTGDTQTTVSGAASDASDAQTADSSAASDASDAQIADGASPITGDAQTTASDAASDASDAQIADSGASPITGDTQVTDSGAASDADDAQLADSGTSPITGDAQTTVSSTPPPASDPQTAGADTVASQNLARPVDPEATSDTTRIAAVEPGTTPVVEAPQVSPAPESTIEKTPVDAPPDAEATGEAGILAVIEDVIERIETAIEERIDTELEVQVTYDDSPVDAPQAEVAPKETTRTPDSDATLPAGDVQAQGSEVGVNAAIAESPGSDDATLLDTDATAAPTATTDADDAQLADSGTSPITGDAQTTVSSTPPPASDPQTAGADTVASQNLARPVDPEATSDTTRIAAVEPGTTPVVEAPQVSPAPESTIEKTPVDAPPDAEATGEAGILAVIEDVIERIETAIEERIDTELEVQVTYDDSPVDAPQAEVAPKETTRTPDSDATLPAGDVQAQGSEVGVNAAIAESPGSDDATLLDTDATAAPTATTDATTTSTADATDAADKEAKQYVETLTDTAPQIIPVDKADHFVTPERVISLVPEDTIEQVSVDDLAGDETLSPDTPITVVREVEQVENAVAEQLLADSGGDLDRELRVQVTYDDSQEETATRVVEEDDVERITVREALERIRTEPDKPLPVIRTVRYFEVMTLKELLDGAVGEDAFLNVVTQPYRIESATLADLLEREKARNPDSIFYLHTVLPTDIQGIWGIVHFGIIDNFARGMAIRRGEDIKKYTVRIPRDADERLADQSSSFLGLMIDRKTRESYVYNFRDNRMGRNPDRIYPGQELVIISFQPEELMSIYTHFAAS